MVSKRFHTDLTRFLHHGGQPMLFRSINLIIVLALLGFSGCGSDDAENAGSTGSLGGDFTLSAVSGPVSLHDYQGKVVLLFFGYTYCPDICPATLDHVASAFDLLSDAELEKVQGIFVTVDPERDSPKHLAEYVSFFHPRFIGLSGTEPQISEAARAYQVEYHRVDSDAVEKYAMIHTTYLFIIGPDGKVVDMMSHKTSPEDIAQAVRQWLSKDMGKGVK